MQIAGLIQFCPDLTSLSVRLKMHNTYTFVYSTIKIFMYSAFIGISLGLVVILSIMLLNKLDKKVVYGLILSGIGWLYVGFTWSDPESFVITAIQAVIFLFVAYLRRKEEYVYHGSRLFFTWFVGPGL